MAAGGQSAGRLGMFHHRGEGKLLDGIKRLASNTGNFAFDVVGS